MSKNLDFLDDQIIYIKIIVLLAVNYQKLLAM